MVYVTGGNLNFADNKNVAGWLHGRMPCLPCNMRCPCTATFCRDAPWCVRIAAFPCIGGRTKVRPYNARPRTMPAAVHHHLSGVCRDDVLHRLN